jgi:DNA-binding NtrC family response regulator/tetratricopeptide (TPR) repeat protein
MAFFLGRSLRDTQRSATPARRASRFWAAALCGLDVEESRQGAREENVESPRSGGSGTGDTARRPFSAREQVREALRQGRLLEALDWLKKTRSAPLDEDSAQLALEQSEALLGLERYSETLAVASRALRRRPRDADHRVRLRIVRAVALWELGRVALARNELRRAGDGASQPLTRARWDEAWARLSWKDHCMEEARQSLARARETYELASHYEGVVRTLDVEGSLLRDAGRISEALDVHTRRIELAATTARIDAVARARVDRGALLVVMGRWTEGREELDRAAELFRHTGDPREITLAGCMRAVVDLATGDLVSARRGVERACELNAREGASPRALAEALLLLADVHLAAGQPSLAEEACGRALRLFGLARDRTGECWARLRRSQALLDQGCARDGLREARRAEAMAPSDKIHLRAWARLAVGRVLLRCARGEAASVFESARSLAGGRPGLADMAAIGVLLAESDRPDEQALREAIGRLEAWGDRQMLGLCLGDIRELVGVVPSACGVEVRCLDSSALDADSGPALVDAAVALANGGGWIAACHSLRNWIPWQRAVWIGDVAWELRYGEDAPRPLGAGDIASELASQIRGPSVVCLEGDGPYRCHPTRVLYDLGFAVLTPLETGGALYVDVRRGASVSESKALVALHQLARLLEAHRAKPVPVPVQEPGLPGTIGESPVMLDVFRWVRRVAGWHVPVHIFGETGTGKELIARALHQHSPRAHGPFVVVNASSLSEDLFESQMFGHVRGSFTGAVANSDGLVAHADKGTLFVDEVADLSPRVQAKLLRFVQEGEYGRVGEPAARKADVRIVTATNVDLRARVAEGAFREDLMYRLFDWTITLPPLRERGDDVLHLAHHFIQDFALEHGRSVPLLSKEAARLIRQCPWPGNVRQLRAEVRRMVVRAEGQLLRREHLSPELRAAAGSTCGGLDGARLAFERDHIAHVLEHFSGNRARAAAALGISRQGLHGKMRRVGLA